MPRYHQETALAIFLALWLAITPCFAWAGSMTLLGVGGPPAAGGAFTGPVDAIASPLGCYSFRACTAALRGQNVANICNSTGGVDVLCHDFVTDATTGDLVAQNLSGVTCPNSLGTCTVKTLYFQTGSFTCNTTCDLVQSTIAGRPVASTSCGSSSKSCMLFDSTKTQLLVLNSGFTVAFNQPMTLIAVAMQTGSLGANNGIMSSGSTNLELIFGSSGAQTAGIYAGAGPVTQAATINVWHSIIANANGANCTLSVDGATQVTPASCSTDAFTSSGNLRVGESSFSEFTTASMREILVYPFAFSQGNDTTMCHNERIYWETAGSC